MSHELDVPQRSVPPPLDLTSQEGQEELSRLKTNWQPPTPQQLQNLGKAIDAITPITRSIQIKPSPVQPT